MPDAVGWLLTFSSLTDQRCLATKTYCNTSRGTTLKPALPCSDTVGRLRTRNALSASA